jgi:hypothetical protein
MFTAEFLDQLAELVSEKVVAKIESRAKQESNGLSAWLDRYGPVMTRDEAAIALKISKRHIINLEGAGKVERAAVPGKQVKYETAQVYRLAISQQQHKRYANQ